jgi:hypothetical protein
MLCFVKCEAGETRRRQLLQEMELRTAMVDRYMFLRRHHLALDGEALLHCSECAVRLAFGAEFCVLSPLCRFVASCEHMVTGAARQRWRLKKSHVRLIDGVTLFAFVMGLLGEHQLSPGGELCMQHNWDFATLHWLAFGCLCEALVRQASELELLFAAGSSVEGIALVASVLHRSVVKVNILVMFLRRRMSYGCWLSTKVRQAIVRKIFIRVRVLIVTRGAMALVIVY